MDVLAKKEHCSIVRPNSLLPSRIQGHAVVVDLAGERIFAVDESFNDEQVWECLTAVNRGYRAGLVAGENSVLTNVKRIRKIKE